MRTVLAGVPQPRRQPPPPRLRYRSKDYSLSHEDTLSPQSDMPPTRTSSKASFAQNVCQLCGIAVTRKDVLRRHMKLHSGEKEKLMIHCHWEGCSYKSLQKSNVQTHLRTHTGEKRRCPSCTFATTDGGSLIRHRKRAHGYKPKASPAASDSISRPIDTIDSSVAKSLYSCDSPTSSSSSSGPKYLHTSAPAIPRDHDFTFPRDKISDKDTVACTQCPGPVPRDSRPIIPVPHLPAAGAGRALQEADLSQFWPSPYPLGTQPAQSFESVSSSPQFQDIHPAYEFTAIPMLFPISSSQPRGIRSNIENTERNAGCGIPWPFSDYTETSRTKLFPDNADYNVCCGAPWSLSETVDNRYQILGFTQSLFASSDVPSLSPAMGSAPSLNCGSSTFSDDTWPSPPSLTDEEFQRFLSDWLA